MPYEQKYSKKKKEIEFKILSLVIITLTLNIFQRIFLQMQNQIFPSNQSAFNNPIPDLHNIFSDKQIVQSYAQKLNQQFIFKTRRRNNNTNYASSQILIQHPQVQQYQKKQKRFAEDDFLGELHSAHIVENFSMLDQKDEHYEQYENVFKGRGQKPAYINENMLASSSENNDVPSRNSSLSSLSDKNQIININSNRYFLHDDLNDKGGKRHHNHVKNSLLAQKSNNVQYRGNSENEMDIENSPYEVEAHASINESLKNKIRNQTFYIQTRTQNSIDFTQSNALISPEKKPIFSNFRRMDIDEDRQRREKLLKIQKIQQMGCNCKKSKCLKMYCECFNLQIFCNENCNCVGCCNQQSNNQHRKAVLDALTRNPKAFNQATQKLQATFQLGVQLAEVKKGCKCKKTKCQKKYCQCYNIGEKCGKFCKCEGCENC